MKIIHLKKQLIPALHLLFWFVSFNFWNVVFNPGVESTGVIEGVEVGWDFILLMNFVFLIYCSLPLIWLIRKARLWIKIPVTILFLAPIVYVMVQGSGQENDKNTVDIFMEFFVKNFLYVLTFHFTIATAVYYNLKILIPRYLTKSKFGQYLLYLVALIGLTAVVNFALFDYCIDLIFPSLYFISYFRIWELVLIVKGYLLLSILVFLIWQYVGMLIANREKAQNELSALKAQINPHFLFNNLNTIYSLASKNDEHTKDVILQLSDFLRYVLYDTASEFIPLEKEVEIIRTYVELQKARVNPEVTTIILTVAGNFANVEITPLLLLPLAENCFKHGIGKNPGKIELYIGFDGKQLLFKTRNAIALRENTGGEVNGGIGIKNVEKRLYLIYPERHSLEYSENEGIFNLEMRIELKK